MQTAATRIDVLDSVSSVRRGAGECMTALHLSRRTLSYGAAAIGGLLLCRAVLRASRPKLAVQQAYIPPRNPWGGVLAQAVSMLVLPLAHAYLTGNRKLPKFSMPHLRMPHLPKVNASYLFYRWLGLEK